MKQTISREILFSYLAGIALLFCVLIEALAMCVIYCRLRYNTYFTLLNWIGVQNIISWGLLLLLAIVLMIPLTGKRLKITVLLALYTVDFMWFYVGGFRDMTFAKEALLPAIAFAALTIFTALGLINNQRVRYPIKWASFLPAVCLFAGRLMSWGTALPSLVALTDIDSSAYPMWLTLLTIFGTHVFELAWVLFLGLWGRSEFFSRKIKDDAAI